MRVDVWLWNVRIFRSRSLATSSVRAGHVRVNGSPIKASYKVKPGDVVRVRIQGFDRILEVVSLPPKRLGAPEAQKCYVDNSPARPRVYLPVAYRPKGSGRPTKKERRELEKLRGPEWAKHSRR